MKFHQLAWITTVVIGIQMVLAGIIVGEDAGFVCPSWPFCSTSGPVPVTGSLIFELVHRVTAVLLGVLVIWLLVWLLKSYRHNRAMLWTCIFGLISLAIQIIYAGLIVLFVFPGTATLVDVLNSVVMLSLFVHLANLAKQNYDSKRGMENREVDVDTASLKSPSWILYGAGMLAVAAGAIFRHTGASQALFGEDSYILSHGRHIPPSHVESELLLMIHIVTAVVLVMAGLWFTYMTFQKRRLTNIGMTIVVLLIVQCILGFASLLTRLEFVVATLHWGAVAVIMGVVAYALSQTYTAQQTEEETQVSVQRTGHQPRSAH